MIERAIKGFGFLGEPRWPAAAEGDPVAAVGVALRACKRHRKPNPGFDLVMSALLRCAIEGNNTGALVLGFLLDRMATDGAGYALLAASWRTKSVVSHAEYVAKDA